MATRQRLNGIMLQPPTDTLQYAPDTSDTVESYSTMAGDKVQCLDSPPNGDSSTELLMADETTPAGVKRKIVFKEKSTRSERQAKYTKKTRNTGVFERFVRNSVGLESLTSGVRTKPLRLFIETGFVEACNELKSEYDREKEKRLERAYTKHKFTAMGKVGFGVASPVLMVNLLQDLRGRTPSGLKECNFCNIKPDIGKGKTDQASYSFFHWDKQDSMSSGVISDYRKREYFLSKRSVKEIDGLGFGICRVLFPGQFDTMLDKEMKDHILLMPAVVITKKPHDQTLHLDDGPGEILFLLHFPLCEEGMLLRVLGNSKKGKTMSDFLRIPFGSYAITRGDVYHAGIYGKSGNFKFHMVVKAAGKYTVSDKLHRLKNDSKPDANKWKISMYKENEMHSFSTDYLSMLRENWGSVIEDAWVQNLKL
jgi:hypothetical protein